MREDLEKLKRGIKYIKSCMLIGSDGEVVTIDVDNQEELAFKLSILFDLKDLEEVLIERPGGASYIKLYDSRLIFLEFTKKPNIPLLNMYLRRIFSENKKQDMEKRVEAVLAEARKTPPPAQESPRPEEKESEESGWEDVSRIFSLR
ncbi:MAG: hypothetical protein GXO66_04455 [Euryarchaeota archaeon]|nr:hypothetical protein [Euryarchaeota archaeon]